MKYLIASVILPFIAQTSAESDLAYTEDSRHFNCSKDSHCPTWFICDTELKVCKCGDGHNYAVVCGDKKLVSAVLDCHCVTYDLNQLTKDHVSTTVKTIEKRETKSIQNYRKTLNH